jgi:hypothetical protein
MNYYDACNELGLDADFDMHAPDPLAQLSKDTPPSKQWQEAGMLIVERAQRYLWHPKSLDGQKALAYLRGRGLTDETIKKARVGYCPLARDGKWYCGEFEHWGIDPSLLREDQRAKGGVRVPDGIIIPWFEASTLWKIAVKRPGEKMDYGQVMGSGEGLYNVDSLQVSEPCMMVEGEFDALSVLQEAGDLINIVATGSSTRGRTGRWLGDLALASFVLQSFDDDASGNDGAAYWLEKLPHALRWQPWHFKDCNDMLQHHDEFKAQTGLTLRGWVEQGLWAAQLPTIPLARVEQSEPAIPVIKPDYQKQIDIQTEFERLSKTDCVNTPQGPGRIWDMQQLRVHIERNRVRVILDRLKGSSTGATELFLCQEIDPIVQKSLFL